MMIQQLTLGAAVRHPNSHGDVWTSTWGPDDAVYTVSDDTYGFDRSCHNNLAVHRLDGLPPTLGATTLNRMTEYGKMAEFRPEDDGMWKANSISCLDGVLYLSVSRHSHPLKQRYFIQEAWDSSIVKSEDFGRTWSPMPELGRAMFPGPTFATLSFAAYGKNGAAGPDGSGEFVYAVSSNGVWNNGSSMTLGRVPRSRLGRLDPADWEFVHGFTLEAGEPIWRRRHDTARYIFRSPGRTSMTGVHHIAPLGIYVMPQWHWSQLDDPQGRWGKTCLEFYQAQTPWGPWTLFHREESPSAWYNPCIVPKFISADGLDWWIFVAGNFTQHERLDAAGRFISEYGLWMIPARARV